MIRKLETHFYDNAIVVEPSIKEKLDDVFLIDNNEKRSLILRYFRSSKRSMSQQATKNLNVIVDDMIHKNSAKKNFDPSNQLWSGDILYTICGLNPSRPIIDALEIQLQDMNKGFCSQGRCTRLYQILASLSPESDDSIIFVDESEDESEEIEVFL